jgi:hypothetical protein
MLFRENKIDFMVVIACISEGPNANKTKLHVEV